MVKKQQGCAEAVAISGNKIIAIDTTFLILEMRFSDFHPASGIQNPVSNK
jgi:hypothetical protein